MPVERATQRQPRERSEQCGRQAAPERIAGEPVGGERKLEARSLGADAAGHARGERADPDHGAVRDAHFACVRVLRDAAVDHHHHRRGRRRQRVADAELGAPGQAVVALPAQQHVERHVALAVQRARDGEVRSRGLVREIESRQRQPLVSARDLEIVQVQLGQGARGDEQRAHEAVGAGAHRGRDRLAREVVPCFAGCERIGDRVARFRQAHARAGQRHAGGPRVPQNQRAETQRQVQGIRRDDRIAARGGAQREPSHFHARGPVQVEALPGDVEPARMRHRAQAFLGELRGERRRDDEGDQHDDERDQQGTQTGRRGHGAETKPRSGERQRRAGSRHRRRPSPYRANGARAMIARPAARRFSPAPARSLRRRFA